MKLYVSSLMSGFTLSMSSYVVKLGLFHYSLISGILLGIITALFFQMNWNKSHIHNTFYR